MYKSEVKHLSSSRRLINRESGCSGERTQTTVSSNKILHLEKSIKGKHSPVQMDIYYEISNVKYVKVGMKTGRSCSKRSSNVCDR